MSIAIITAIRSQSQLHGSLFHTAKELAHRASDSGTVTISYSYLAGKCHQSRRTTIRHINKLIEFGIITCQRFWQRGKKWLCNRYQFRIAWQRPKTTAQMRHSDTLTPNLPQQEKYGSLVDEERGRARVLSWLSPDSALYQEMKKAPLQE